MSLEEPVLFIEFVERWLELVAPLRYKATAIEEYGSLLRLHLLPVFGLRPLGEIGAAEVQGYLAGRVKAGFAPRSVRNDLTVLRAVLKSAEAFGLVDANVAMKAQPPRHVRKEQRFLAPHELRAVLDATPEAWRILIALPIYAAARKGECLALRWPQISFDRRQIAFIASMRAGVEYSVKTAASRATVAMADELAPLLEARRRACPDPVGGYVFCRSDGRPLDDGTPNRVLRRACVDAGVEPCTYHQLRHSAIAALIATGAHPLIVSRFARHASIETTMDLYGHLLAPAGGDAILDFSRLIAGSK
jgi:integrase